MCHLSLLLSFVLSVSFIPKLNKPDRLFAPRGALGTLLSKVPNALWGETLFPSLQYWKLVLLFIWNLF